MRINWNRWVPLGGDGKTEFKWIVFCLGIGVLGAVITFFDHYTEALDNLYMSRMSSASMVPGLPRGQLIPGAKMAPFLDLMMGCEMGFLLIAVLMPVLAAVHYAAHWYGSKSIYLMRRLPDRWELHRRCLTVPAAGLVSALALLGLLGIGFYCVYLLCTPAQCLPG